MNSGTKKRRQATITRREILGATLGEADGKTLADVFQCEPAQVQQHLLAAVDVAFAVDRSSEREAVRRHIVAHYDLLAFTMVRSISEDGSKEAARMLRKIIRGRQRIVHG